MVRIRVGTSTAALIALVVPASASAAAPPDAVPVGPAAADRELSVLLGLRRDEAGLARFVARVSDPDSPSFGRYADVPELARRFGAPARQRRVVLSWLRSNGLRGRVSATGGWVETSMTVGRSERLFRTPLRTYRSAAGRRFVAPARTPRLPAALRGRVTELVGLNDRRHSAAGGAQPPPVFTPEDGRKIDDRFRQRGSSLRVNSGTPRGCAAARASATSLGGGFSTPAYTPNQYLHAYRYDKLHRQGLRGQGQRIAVIEIDGFKRSDVTTFARCFGVRAPATPITRVGIERNLTPGDETTLDLEVLSAAAPGLEEIQVMETTGSNSTLVGGYERVLARPKRRRASVISASLGQCEPDFYGDTGAVALYENVFRTAAAAGVSNVASTGDVGSTGCPLGDNSAALALLAVQHPSSSPYVTAVGGTNLELNRRNRIVEEVTWHDAPFTFGGGTGGYSLFFERPSWQRGPGVGGPQRIVPDIAMLADGVPGYAIYCSNAACDNAGWGVVGGTSAATPLFAAGVAIANQQADRAGTSRLGYLNPLIYRLASKGSRRPVFNDVLETNNDLASLLPADAGGGKPIGCCKATPNHDAASGWGSIFLPAFSRAARRLAEQGTEPPRRAPGERG